MGEGQDDDAPSPAKDRIIDSRNFEMGGGIDLGAFLSDESLESAKKPVREGSSPTDATAGALPEPTPSEEIDEAIGDMFDPFEKDSGPNPGDVLPDGTVYMTPEMDTITEIAVEGERRLHWALMVAMIFVYSLVGWLVATALDPFAATAGLVGLATLGFVLGERWIPDKGMHLLGVTWVIISMKLMYGLALDAHHWGWIDTQILGITLIGLVGVNILVGYRHGHDAIMAQATLVSLAIASAAGSIGGELGVTVMILLAIILLHGLALHRRSGNLASLGIAASHLWIGFHAIQSTPLHIGALVILPLDDPMPLFLLALAVTGINGAMAARFAREENWFSKGIAITGLGKPGLWGVSIGLGMIGAMLLLASGRDVTGYALGILMTLIAVYGGSYLVVRGVDEKDVLKPLMSALPVLLILLVILESNEISKAIFGDYQLPISGYESFAALSALVTIGILLKHQSNVTDRVLWTGSLVLMLLLTILIPAESTNVGGDEGKLLLISFVILHISTAVLAIYRDSPSIAGVTVLAPWLWMVVYRFWTSSLENFSDAREIDVSGWDVIMLDPSFVAIYLTIAALLQYPVNMKLGETGVNIAGKLIGASELTARLRDSGLMRLWNLGLISGLIVWLMFVDVDHNIGWLSILGFSALVIVHITAEAQGRHQDNPRLILISLAIVMIVFQWNLGVHAVWITLLTATSVTILLTRGEDGPNSELLSLTMGLLSVQIMLFALDRHISFPLIDPEPLTRSMTGGVILFASICIVAVYLPIASKLEKILQPAITIVLLLTILIWATSADDMHWSESIIALALFVGTALYLAAQGELRAELKQVGKREARLLSIARKQQIAAALESGNLANITAQQSPMLEAPTRSTAMIPETVSTSESALDISQDGDELPLELQQGSNLYHFSDETLAAKAASDPTGKLAKSISQAVSKGGMKMADSELLSLMEKQRKRRRKAGVYGNEEMDLLVGDIHHRPIIVISFIAVTTFAACWFAYFDSSSNPGLMLIVTLFALALTWISRERARIQHLRLPDFNGIELPFAVTMCGLGIIYLVGHFGIHGSLTAQLDLLVLTFALLGLALISLYGRDDLAWRIPSAVEWIVLVLLLTRVLGALFINAVPFPMSVNPLDPDLSMVDWMVPWLFHEAVLLILVFVWEWIEGFRRTKGMPDHRGAAGRGGFACMIVLVSAGPAGLLASLLCLRRSFDWKQPAGAAIAINAGLASLLAFSPWFDYSNTYMTYISWTILLTAIIMVLAHLYTILYNLPKWTTAWLWNAHILLPIGVLAVTGWNGWMVVAILALSLVTWVGGILQLRRGMRVMGAFDLVLSIAVWLLILQDNVLDSQMLLLMLLALGVELGIVAWLGTRHQLQLAQD